MRLATRILSRLLLLTLLGLTTSIAIAWALAAWLPNSHCTSTSNSVGFSKDGFVTATTYTRPGMIRRAWETSEWGEYSGAVFPIRIVNDPIRSGASSSIIGLPGEWGQLTAARMAEPGGLDDGFEDARGWPVPSFWYSVSPYRISLDFLQSSLPPPELHGGLLLTSPTPTTAAEIRALPYLPIWKGLTINTAFYATLWASAWAAFRTTRLLLRRRRGLCPTCAYDLKHNLPPGCPECGWKRAASPSASTRA